MLSLRIKVKYFQGKLNKLDSTYSSFKKCTKQYSTKTPYKWKPPDGFKTNIQVYNPICKEKVELITKNENLLSWYCCGPTVYDSAHIGHACSYMQYDIIRRILEDYFNINVVMVMNITDIDDKIIMKSNEVGVEFSEISRRFEKEFFNNLDSLNIKRPTIVARVSDYMEEIVSFVNSLVNKGHGYVMPDGSVNFSVDKFPLYGKLVPVPDESEMKSGKECSKDFALWKAAKPDEPSWPSPWGRGRPGWHIECSAIASKLLGTSIDIHSGGLDLKFPHHENEEAQCCAHHNISQWVNYWLHTGHLYLNPEVKMSKSLKNTISIDDFLSKYTANDFRMLCMLVPYRHGVEYSDELMGNAASVEKKMSNFLNDCDSYIKGDKENSSVDESLLLEKLDKTKNEVRNSLSQDFDTGSVITHLAKLMSTTNNMLQKQNSGVQESTSYAVLAVSNYIRNCLYRFGFAPTIKLANNSLLLENVMESAIDFRSKVREAALLINKEDPKEMQENKATLLKACDSFRSDLITSGIELKDHGKKTSWNIHTTAKSMG